MNSAAEEFSEFSMEQPTVTFLLNDEQALELERITKLKEELKESSSQAKINYKQGIIGEDEYVTLKSQFTSQRKKLEAEARLYLMTEEEKEELKRKKRDSAKASRKRRQDEIVTLNNLRPSMAASTFAQAQSPILEANSGAFNLTENTSEHIEVQRHGIVKTEK
jgi:hypothetical protein